MDKTVVLGGANFEITEIFDLLESNNLELVQEIKAEITETFSKCRDSWLVVGLFEYYLQTGSGRCVDILCSISKEPHDKFLIDKITEGIRSPSKEVKKQALTLFSHVVSRQPSWLYKITQQTLFKELLQLLKTETDVVVLLLGILSVIMIIPTLPSYVHPFIQDVFTVFGRLAAWANQSYGVPKEHVLHLQVALYSLFHRLYALYPCNFLAYLRQNFISSDKKVVFFHTIMPMLEKVKMHPFLVTATRDGELHPQRWKSKEYHEIIAECSKISLDVYESSFPEEITPTFSRLSSIDIERDTSLPPDTPSSSTSNWTVESLLRLPTSTLISQAMKSDLTSLISYLDDTCNTAPPTPLSSLGGPQSAMIINKTASPTETAMEATPENTPIKERSHFKLPPTSPAAMQLSFSTIEQVKEKYAKPFPAVPPSTPVPSSPLPVIAGQSNLEPTSDRTSSNNTTSASGHAFVRRDSIFDTVGSTLRRDSLIYQRLQKVQLEQSQTIVQEAAAATIKSPTPYALTTTAATSKVSEATAFHQRKLSVPAPITIPTVAQNEEAYVGSLTSEFLNDRERPTGGPLTPMLPHNIQHHPILDPDLTLITVDEEGSIDDCSTTGCPQGGLHMADHKQMIAFAKRVSRLRFHSQCAPGPDSTTGFLPSPGTSPSSSSSSGLQNIKSRVIKRSYSLPNIKKPLIQDGKPTEVRNADLRKDSDAKDIASCTSTEVGTPSSSVVVVEQTEEDPAQPQQPYEHLFQQILPTVLSPPLDSRTVPSPHLLLDLCVMKAASLHNARGKADEITLLRGQVSLLHGQLLFERHRREAHALRNRRLAGKCREMQTMEEKNISMRREIHNLEKEIVLLKQEMLTQRTMNLIREKDMEAKTTDLEHKLDNYRIQLSDLKDEKLQIQLKYARLQEEFLLLQKESDHKNSELFSLENEIKHLQKFLNMNNELKSAYDISQKEILLLGELLRRHQEAVFPPLDSKRYLKEEMEDLRLTCEEEIRGLRNLLDNKASQYEAAIGMIQDLEKKLEKREAIIMEQKQILVDAESLHEEKLQEYQNKYESVKMENQKLELEILNLEHLRTQKTHSSRSGRGRITSSPSNGESMSPTGNSNHSDVDSATSAAGLYQLSPDRNTCFFGSPQFDVPSEEMRDLHHVLDRTTQGHSRRDSTFQD